MTNPTERMTTDSLERRTLALLAERGWRLATAESCTGGGIGARLTSVPGASDHYVGGVVSYANEVKRDVLGVPEATLRDRGA
ncbi:MAG: CinA family protein, partial [Fibrobacterales bacterium]|nr:CinA family protein [Fibrobacterales bacterium]